MIIWLPLINELKVLYIIIAWNKYKQQHWNRLFWIENNNGNNVYLMFSSLKMCNYVMNINVLLFYKTWNNWLQTRYSIIFMEIYINSILHNNYSFQKPIILIQKVFLSAKQMRYISNIVKMEHKIILLNW